jgi:hypothetical protein
MKTTRQLVNETACAISSLLSLITGCGDEKVNALLDQEEVKQLRCISKKIFLKAEDRYEEMDRKNYPLSEDRMTRMDDRIHRIEAQDEN